jgi:hypothetical protein
LSSDPLTNPFSAEVAYLTVLHEIVDSVRVTLSDASAAVFTAARNAKLAVSTARARAGA